jgi:hypothetical protein
MKSMVEFFVNAHRLPGGAKRFLETTGCAAVAKVQAGMLCDVFQELISINLEAGDERIDKIIAMTQPYDEDPIVSRYYDFTEEERQTAPLLVMTRDANEYLSAGAWEGTKYDLTNACPICGTGARQTSALYVHNDAQRIRKHRAIGGDEGSILVDLGLENKLRAAGVTGVSFGDVYGRSKPQKRTLLARQQIIVEHSLPPEASNGDLARTNACTKCHRGNMSYAGPGPYRTVYRRQDINDIRDFNLSWEWFGSFEPSSDPSMIKLPMPHTLVTPKVMNIFREAGVTTFEWTPIFIED